MQMYLIKTGCYTKKSVTEQVSVAKSIQIVSSVSKLLSEVHKLIQHPFINTLPESTDKQYNTETQR